MPVDFETWQLKTQCVACPHTETAGHLDGNTLTAEWAFHYWTTHGWDPEEVVFWIEDWLQKRS